ncbi:hypothetical protein KY289_017467 [Solanum tuberosum]|nr:hypothetical protein KY289_017467 [Solanum tuberosum]
MHVLTSPPYVFVASVSSSSSSNPLPSRYYINLFCHIQSIPDLQGLLHSLNPRCLSNKKFYLFKIHFELRRTLMELDLALRMARGPECYQSYATVVQVLFRHFLRDTEDQSVTSLDHIFTVESMEITSPSTDSEISLALRVLEGVDEHTVDSVLGQGACLDALIAIMLDSSANQAVDIFSIDSSLTEVV